MLSERHMQEYVVTQIDGETDMRRVADGGYSLALFLKPNLLHRYHLKVLV